MEALERKLAEISSLSPQSKTIFLAAWKHWSAPKNHFLIREHAISDYLYFIEKGIARIYYYKGDKEVTEWIAIDEQFLLSITSFFERKPSHLIIQTIEASEVYGIHHNDFMMLADQHHDIERMLRKMVTVSLILSQQRMDSIQFESAQQRYNRLVNNFPQMIQRVPLSFIASFLGVTLETLSRIRNAR